MPLPALNTASVGVYLSYFIGDQLTVIVAGHGFLIRTRNAHQYGQASNVDAFIDNGVGQYLNYSSYKRTLPNIKYAFFLVHINFCHRFRPSVVAECAGQDRTHTSITFIRKFNSMA